MRVNKTTKPDPRAPILISANDKVRIELMPDPPRPSLLERVLMHGEPVTDQQLDAHMEAYRNARFYHATSRTSVPSILAQGLDPAKRGSSEGAEAIANPKGVAAAKNDPAVFLGGDITTTRYYNRKLKQPPDAPHLRAFLTPAQALQTREDTGDATNLAFRSDDLVPPQSLSFGRHGDQSESKLRSIFGIVRQHYPGGGEGVTTDEVMRRHAVAIQRGLTTHSTKQYAKPIYQDLRTYRFEDEGYVSD